MLPVHASGPWQGLQHTAHDSDSRVVPCSGCHATGLRVQVLILLAALATCDPGNILDTIEQAKQAKVRVSIVGLAANVFICEKVAEVRAGSKQGLGFRCWVKDQLPTGLSLLAHACHGLTSLACPRVAHNSQGARMGASALCCLYMATSLQLTARQQRLPQQAGAQRCPVCSALWQRELAGCDRTAGMPEGLQRLRVTECTLLATGDGRQVHGGPQRAAPGRACSAAQPAAAVQGI